MNTEMTTELTPEESLAILRRTLAQARRELIMPDGPIAKAWGLAVLTGFTGMFAVRAVAVPAPFAAVAAAAVWAIAIAGGLVYSTVLGRAYYATGRGVWSPVMGRLMWVWVAGFLMAAATGVAARLGVDGVIGVIAFFVAAFYVMSGVLCFDNIELGVGLWIGAVNIVALLLGPLGYPLVMGVLVGGGLVVSGFLDDRKWARIIAQAGG
jgi:hypothetical protein